MTFELYQEKLTAMGGIVEEWIPGAIKESPAARQSRCEGSVNQDENVPGLG